MTRPALHLHILFITTMRNDNMVNENVMYLSKAIATVGTWLAVAWLLIETNASGGTTGWVVFFVFLATAEIWCDGKVKIL